jgi:hypothetical protein
VSSALSGADRETGARRLAADPLLWLSAAVTTLVCAPFFRYVFWLGDEGVVLHGAERVLRGEVLYRDFFEFLPPGSFLLLAGWMHVVGSDLASVRALAALVIVATAALTYGATRLAGGSRAVAALLVVGWAALSQGGWTVISHHWLATAASMASAVCLLAAVCSPAARRAGFFAAGLFAGAAALMVTTRGGLLCLAVVGTVLLGRGGRMPLAAAVAGMAALPAAALAYLAMTGAVTAAVSDVLLFPAQHYSDIQGVAFGAAAALHQAPAAVFFPVTLVLAGAAALLDRTTLWRQTRFQAAVALALVGLLGAFPRPDITHINFTLPLACPLFGLLAAHLRARLPRRVGLAVSAVVVLVCGLAVGWRLLSEALPMVAGPLRGVPTARGVLVGPPSPWIDAIGALVPHIERAPRDEPYFFYPYSPMLPYLTARRHVGPLDVMVPGYTTAAQYREVCERVVREARWVVLDRTWSHPDVLRTFFPSMRDPDPPAKRALETALDRAFDRIIHAWRGMELRGRGPHASVAMCGTGAHTATGSARPGTP